MPNAKLFDFIKTGNDIVHGLVNDDNSYICMAADERTKKIVSTTLN